MGALFWSSTYSATDGAHCTRRHLSPGTRRCQGEQRWRTAHLLCFSFLWTQWIFDQRKKQIEPKSRCQRRCSPTPPHRSCCGSPAATTTLTASQPHLQLPVDLPNPTKIKNPTRERRCEGWGTRQTYWQESFGYWRGQMPPGRLQRRRLRRLALVSRLRTCCGPATEEEKFHESGVVGRIPGQGAGISLGLDRGRNLRGLTEQMFSHGPGLFPCGLIHEVCHRTPAGNGTTEQSLRGRGGCDTLYAKPQPGERSWRRPFAHSRSLLRSWAQVCYVPKFVTCRKDLACWRHAWCQHDTSIRLEE